MNRDSKLLLQMFGFLMVYGSRDTDDKRLRYTLLSACRISAENAPATNTERRACQSTSDCPCGWGEGAGGTAELL